MIAAAATPDAKQYTVQYELLRAQVLGAGSDAVRPHAVGQPRAVGLALMLREGMPGWLKALEAVMRASLAPRTHDAAHSPTTQSPDGECGSAPAWLLGVPRHDLTALVASLVLSTRRVECSSPTEECVPCH